MALFSCRAAPFRPVSKIPSTAQVEQGWFTLLTVGKGDLLVITLRYARMGGSENRQVKKAEGSKLIL